MKWTTQVNRKGQMLQDLIEMICPDRQIHRQEAGEWCPGSGEQWATTWGCKMALGQWQSFKTHSSDDCTHTVVNML
jgi:hypothetical protein